MRPESDAATTTSAEQWPEERWIASDRPWSLALAMLRGPAIAVQRSAPRTTPAETKGVNSGNYNIQQSIEFGYRANEVNGNKDTYDTFMNLGSGVRLFDYSLDMRSLDHQGLLFDDLTFQQLRLRRRSERRFAAAHRQEQVVRLPLDVPPRQEFLGLQSVGQPAQSGGAEPCWVRQTAVASSVRQLPLHPGLPGLLLQPAVAPTNSPHASDLVRRMQDYDLTLLPQSRVRFRLGFSHDRDEGPGFFTTDSGTVPDFPENYSYTTNAYRAGVDFRVLPRTTISYDQFFSYFKQDNAVLESPTATPQNYGYQLANGTPVDLGIVWSTQTPAEALPCARADHQRALRRRPP